MLRRRARARVCKKNRTEQKKQNRTKKTEQNKKNRNRKRKMRTKKKFWQLRKIKENQKRICSDKRKEPSELKPLKKSGHFTKIKRQAK
ncbi:MAG TPA: hypothetical protein PKL57_00770 [Candidatus Wallbacteria bacterium]|nr:hypothetical protein [Candidatus Wallbacteria bacterium]